MALPTTRQEFAEYCLRKLGRPSIKIDVTDEQVDDRIDEAIKFWQDFNTDGTQRQLYKYVITDTDMTNQYITLPENIIGVVKIFEPGDAYNIANIFNIRYQIALNDLYTLTSVSMAPFYMAFQHIALLEQLLVGMKPIRYNRITNTLYLDMDWNTWTTGNYVIVDCYQVIDPNQFPQFWQDRTLQNYATALIKKNWGQALSKFGNMQMSGGVTFNGKQIYDEAENEIARIENEIKTSYQTMGEVFIG